MKKPQPKNTKPHPLQELVLAAFAERKSHDDVSLGFFLARGARCSDRTYNAYKAVARDVLGYMEKQGLLYRSEWQPSFFSLVKPEQYAEDAADLERFREAYLKLLEDPEFKRLLEESDWAQRTHLEADKATQYAQHFIAEERSGKFRIARSRTETTRAFVWAIEAVRALSYGGSFEERAARLLKLAAAEIDARWRRTTDAA
jgi:hypothetical protein